MVATPLHWHYRRYDGAVHPLNAARFFVQKSAATSGIILDADGHLAERWNKVRVILASAGLEIAAQPNPSGTVINGLRPGSQIGIWLMPDNQASGNLESFLAKLVPPGNACWEYALQATQAALGQGCTVGDQAKAALRAWLAWQESPGLPFGTAVQAGIFNHESEEALRFVAWFNLLFAIVENQSDGNGM